MANKELWTEYNGKGFGAEYADYAVRATKDEDGNVIADTYATKDAMTGATAQANGKAGLVPAPAAGDQGKVLAGDGNWSEVEEYTNAYIDSLGWLTGPSIVVGGKEYPYVRIGNQLWLAENLKFAIPGVTLDVSPVTYNDVCILSNPNTPGYANQYGYLYTRGAAVQISSGGYLPSGWRVPTKTDIETLNSYLSNNGLVLKSSSGWYDNGNGTDDYRFNALPAGYYDSSNGGYLDITKKFEIWTTTNFGSYRGSILKLVNNSNVIMLDTSLYSCCLSIRLVKDVT